MESSARVPRPSSLRNAEAASADRRWTSRCRISFPPAERMERVANRNSCAGVSLFLRWCRETIRQVSTRDQGRALIAAAHAMMRSKVGHGVKMFWENAGGIAAERRSR